MLPLLRRLALILLLPTSVPAAAAPANRPNIVFIMADDLGYGELGRSLYDLATDPGETNNLAADQPGLIAEAIALLKKETSRNPVFPFTVPY